MNKDYCEQDGCWNCKICFVKVDHDMDTAYYCTKDAPKRPLCLSVAMNEYKIADDYDDYDAWEEWSKDKTVEPWGKCSDWDLWVEK